MPPLSYKLLYSWHFRLLQYLTLTELPSQTALPDRHTPSNWPNQTTDPNESNSKSANGNDPRPVAHESLNSNKNRGSDKTLNAAKRRHSDRDQTKPVTLPPKRPEPAPQPVSALVGNCRKSFDRISGGANKGKSGNIQREPPISSK